MSGSKVRRAAAIAVGPVLDFERSKEASADVSSASISASAAFLFALRFAGGVLLMEHVLSYGHRRIGIISVNPDVNMAIQLRLDGMLSAVDDANLDIEIPMMDSDFSVKGGAQAARQLLQDHPDLSVIICLNDRMAIGAMSAMQQMGLHIPDDISVIGYDDIPVAATTQPLLTTINQKPVELGRAAAEIMLKRLNGAKPSNVVISPVIVTRQSLAAQR